MHILFMLLGVPIVFILVGYCWTQGVQLFRWVAFIPLFIIAMILATAPFSRTGNETPEIITIPLGIAAAWIIASIPTYLQRHREREEERRWEEAQSKASASRSVSYRR